MPRQSTIKVTGEKELLRTLQKYHGDKRRQSKEVVEFISLKVMNRAKEYAPVDEGRLRNSISILERRSDGLGASVGTNVVYAPDVEFGTPEMEAAHGKHDPENPVTSWAAKDKGGGDPRTQMPFLKPALLDNRKEFIERLMAVYSKVR